MRFGCRCLNSSRSSFNLCSRRATKMSDRARPASCRANSRPIPADAPVIRALQPLSFIFILSFRALRLRSGQAPSRNLSLFSWPQQFKLPFCERAPVAAWQIAEPEITDANTDQTFHFVTNFVKHATNLPINSLAQDDAQMSGFNRMKPLDVRAFAIEKNSFR